MPIETWKKIWWIGHIVAGAGIAQFVICCLIAMWLYPGGTVFDENTIGYSFADNYLSDLGIELSYSGQDNLLGSRFFNWSTIALSFCMAPFFFFFPTQAADRLVSLSLAAVFGAVSLVALACVGLFHLDVHPILHSLSLFLWLASLFFCTSIHGLALLTSRDDQTWLSLLSIALAMTITAYFMQASDTAAAIFRNEIPPVQAVFTQKLVVLLCIGWFASFTAKMLVSTDFSDFEPRPVSEETSEYLRRLGGQPIASDQDQRDRQNEASDVSPGQPWRT